MLTEKPMIVVATKVDATTDRTKLEELQKFCQEQSLEFHAISAPTGEGVKELVRGMADALDKIPKEALEDVDTAPEAGVEYVDIGSYEDPDESEPDEDGPPIAKIS